MLKETQIFKNTSGSFIQIRIKNNVICGIYKSYTKILWNPEIMDCCNNFKKTHYYDIHINCKYITYCKKHFDKWLEENT